MCVCLFFLKHIEFYSFTQSFFVQTPSDWTFDLPVALCFCALQDDLEEGSDSDDDVGAGPEKKKRVGRGSDMLLSLDVFSVKMVNP